MDVSMLFTRGGDVIKAWGIPTRSEGSSTAEPTPAHAVTTLDISVFNSLLWCYSVAPATLYGPSAKAQHGWSVEVNAVAAIETALMETHVVPDRVTLELMDTITQLARRRELNEEVAGAAKSAHVSYSCLQSSFRTAARHRSRFSRGLEGETLCCVCCTRFRTHGCDCCRANS